MRIRGTSAQSMSGGGEGTARSAHVHRCSAATIGGGTGRQIRGGACRKRLSWPAAATIGCGMRRWRRRAFAGAICGVRHGLGAGCWRAVMSARCTTRARRRLRRWRRRRLASDWLRRLASATRRDRRERLLARPALGQRESQRIAVGRNRHGWLVRRDCATARLRDSRAERQPAVRWPAAALRSASPKPGSYRPTASAALPQPRASAPLGGCAAAALHHRQRIAWIVRLRLAGQQRARGRRRHAIGRKKRIARCRPTGFRQPPTQIDNRQRGERRGVAQIRMNPFHPRCSL